MQSRRLQKVIAVSSMTLVSIVKGGNKPLLDISLLCGWLEAPCTLRTGNNMACLKNMTAMWNLCHDEVFRWTGGSFFEIHGYYNNVLVIMNSEHRFILMNKSEWQYFMLVTMNSKRVHSQEWICIKRACIHEMLR